MKREDQNTFLMIAAILIVCLIALFAVLNSIWLIIRSPVNSIANEIGYFIRFQSLDYNFSVPLETQAIVPEPTPIPSPQPTPQPTTTQPPMANNNVTARNDLDYNFYINLSDVVVTTFSVYKDAILSEQELIALGNNQSIEDSEISIEISKLKINSPVLQGIDSKTLLTQGFWLSSSSNELGEGEIMMFCQRRFFGPYDPRSCWFLDNIVKGDQIIVNYKGNLLYYQVIGSNIFNADDPLIYSISPDEDFIRIITTHPLYSNEQRLVILAERIG